MLLRLVGVFEEPNARWLPAVVLTVVTLSTYLAACRTQEFSADGLDPPAGGSAVADERLIVFRRDRASTEARVSISRNGPSAVSAGGCEGKHPRQVPGHGDKAPFASHAVEPTQ
jgi:hypothetical protein